MSEYDATDPNPEYQYSDDGNNIEMIDRGTAYNSWNSAYPDAVDMPTQDQGIQNVLDKADGYPIDTLTVVDHGRPGLQVMGDRPDPRVRDDKLAYLNNLSQLYGHFSEDGRVDLQGCSVASDETGVSGTDYVRDVTTAVGVPVTAGLGPQLPHVPGYEGSTMTCVPGETAAEPIDCGITDVDQQMSVPVD